MEEDSKKNIVNHYEAGSNCQVFNGDITGCVFAMPGSTVTQNSRWPADSPRTAPGVFPEQLKSEAAEELKADLVDAGILTDQWQPLNLSGTERALVARAVCDRLQINEIWQVFGQLWGEKPETLRSYLNKALDQKKSLKFQDRLKAILD